ncbi:MAG TPA: hypothetical protein VHN99_07825 [Deinococcales bacterium]|nr:hypothetical protein [Deinococcales bacterium]
MTFIPPDPKDTPDKEGLLRDSGKPESLRELERPAEKTPEAGVPDGGTVDQEQPRDR